MGTEEDDLNFDGRLFHKNTILLKCEFLKRGVLLRFGRRSPELERVERCREWVMNWLMSSSSYMPELFTFVKEYDVFYFMPI